jgi:hypothetical protein
MILTTFKQIQDPKQEDFSVKKQNTFFTTQLHVSA